MLNNNLNIISNLNLNITNKIINIKTTNINKIIININRIISTINTNKIKINIITNKIDIINNKINRTIFQIIMVTIIGILLMISIKINKIKINHHMEMFVFSQNKICSKILMIWIKVMVMTNLIKIKKKRNEEEE